MKTTITIEIETKDKCNVFEEDNPERTGVDLDNYQKEFAQNVHSEVIKEVEKYLKDNLEEDFIDNLEEQAIDGWDDFECFGVTVKHTVKHNK